MGPWSRTLTALTLIAAAGLCVGAAPTPYDTAMAPYKAALSRYCPAKRLQYLNPSTLDAKLQAYMSHLPAKERRFLAERDKLSCRYSLGGVTCQNVGYIKALHELKRTASLARFVCRSEPGGCNDDICNPF